MHVGIDSHGAEREGEGNSTYWRNLIREFLARGEPDTLALLAGDPEHAFYRSLPLRSPSRTWRVRQGRGVARVLWSLSRQAARAEVDALHVQYFAPFFYRGPLIVTVHDLGFEHVPQSFPPILRLALRMLVPWSIRRAARVITVSEFTREDIVRRYRVCPAKVSAIPLGVGPDFRPRGEAEIKPTLARYALEPGFLFSLSRLNRRKNLETLVGTYAALRARGLITAPLVIGGKPDYGADALPAVASQLEPGAIRWVGLIPDADLAAFYCGAACFVFPSLFEGFGLPVLEAMACGCAVISSNRAAMPEVVGGAGLLVDPLDGEALEAAIGRVLTDAGWRRELGERGRARSLQFTWWATAAATLAVYREAAGAQSLDASPDRRSRTPQ